MLQRLHALVPSPVAFELSSNAGTSYLVDAGFDVKLLVGHSSIFSAYSSGVGEIVSAGVPDNAVVLLVHSDVHFHGLPRDAFVRLICRHLDMPSAGFVGVAGTRLLRPELVWWRNASGAAALAGMVHHGLERDFAERSFFVWDSFVLFGPLLSVRGMGSWRASSVSLFAGVDF